MLILKLLMLLMFFIGRVCMLPLTLLMFIIMKAHHNAIKLDMTIHNLYKISRRR